LHLEYISKFYFINSSVEQTPWRHFIIGQQKLHCFFNYTFYYCPPPPEPHSSKIGFCRSIYFLVLGTFPKAFSQGRLPKWQFPKWQLPKCAISQAVQLAAMGAEHWGWDGLEGRAPRLEQAWGPTLRLRQTWEVGTWEIAHLGSSNLGKYPWEIFVWKKSFGRVP